MSPVPYIPRRPNPRPGLSVLTPIEVAAELRVSKMTIYRLIRRKELSAIQVGRSFRITEQALNDYIRRCAGGDDES